MRRNSVKMIKINREFQRELSTLISMEVKDPRISPMTSVVSVDVAPDLKTSKVYISVLGDAQDQKNTLIGLRSAAPFLRTQLAHNLNLRNTPELNFIVDQSIEYGVNMSHMIETVIEHDEANYVPNPVSEDDSEAAEEETDADETEEETDDNETEDEQ